MKLLVNTDAILRDVDIIICQGLKGTRNKEEWINEIPGDRISLLENTQEMKKQSSGWGRLFSHYLSEIGTLTKNIKGMEKPRITPPPRFKNRQLTITWHGGPHPVFGGLRQKNF